MYCEHCGNQLPNDAKFCSKCGMPVTNGYFAMEQSTEEEQAYTSKNMPQGYGEPQFQQPSGYDQPGQGRESGLKAWVIALISVALLVCVIGGVAFYIHLNGKDQETSSYDMASSGTEDDAANQNDEKEKTIIAEEDVDETLENEEPEEEDELPEFEKMEDQIQDLRKAYLSFVSCDVSDYPTVRLYYTVEDDLGNMITLDEPQVMIREMVSGGEVLERTVKSFAQLEGREGISIDIVADKSGSMDGYLYEMKNIMTQFVNHLDYSSGDRAELIAFDSYVMYMCTYTGQLSLLQNGIQNMEADGSTALYDALYGAVMNAGSQDGARCVIAFTDGDDNVSTHSWQEVVSLAQMKEVPVFIIGFGTLAYRDDLVAIATQTGGLYQDIGQLQDMSGILQSIYADRKDMYCLEYTSGTNIDAYDVRDIELVLADDIYGGETKTEVTPVKVEKHKHNSRYEVIKADVSWEEANAECLERGGHLITITSKEEERKAQKLAAKEGLNYIWIGGYTSRNEWEEIFGHWVTGEAFTYEKWFAGEPSGYDQDGEREMYLMLWNVQGKWSWNDQRNDPIRDTGLAYFKGKTGYICEYEDEE